MNTTTRQQSPVEAAPHLRGEHHDVSQHHNAADCIRDYPVTSAIVTMAVGIGAGFCIGALLGGATASKSHDNIAQRLGHQMMDSMSGIMPGYFSKS